MWCIWLPDFGSGFGKILKCQTDLQKKCQMGLHNDIEKNKNHVFGKHFWERLFWESRINRAFLLPKNDFWENVLAGFFGKILFEDPGACFWEIFGRTERTIKNGKKEFQGSLS